MAPSRITIKDIARAVGVHHATVSRALREDPRIAKETALRVKSAAKELGYEPDPMMHALAAYRAGLRPQGFKETLGFIWPENTPEEVAHRLYVSRTITAARAHAAELGYKVDEFFLPRQSEHSVERILRARGIRGIIIGGIGHTTALKLSLDLAEFAVAAVSSTLLTPRLHRTGHDHFNGMQIALRRLTELGYRKIAFVVGREQEEILNRKYIGSFLAHHPLGHAAAQGLVRSVTMAGTGEIASALRDLRPDCLLLTYTPNPLPVQRGKPVPVVSLDLLRENPIIAGVYQQTALAAAAAVDFVVEQILHGKRGIPAERKNMLTDGCWIDHPSCPPRTCVRSARSRSATHAPPTRNG